MHCNRNSVSYNRSGMDCNMGSMDSNRGKMGSISSMRDMGGLNRLTCSCWDLIVDIRTLNLSHNMAVLNINWDKFDLGVVNAVLGCDITASMLHCLSERVGKCMGSNWSSMDRSSNMVACDGMLGILVKS